MSQICQNCGKGVMRGNKVARARQELLYRSPKVFKPNLHNAKIKQADGTVLKLKLCTKCQRLAKKFAAEQMGAVKTAETKQDKLVTPKKATSKEKIVKEKNSNPLSF